MFALFVFHQPGKIWIIFPFFVKDCALWRAVGSVRSEIASLPKYFMSPSLTRFQGPDRHR